MGKNFPLSATEADEKAEEKNKDAEKTKVDDMTKMTKDEFFDYVNKNKAEIDYKKLAGDKKLIFVGETHDIPEHREETEKILRDMDAKVLAMEVLPALEQAYIDAYLKGENDGSKIKNYLKKHMPSNYESYMRLINYAKKNRIKVIGLEIFGFKDTGWFTEPFGKRFEERNKYMSEVIKKYMKGNPDHRVVVLVGGAHVNPQAGPPYSVDAFFENDIAISLHGSFEKPVGTGSDYFEMAWRILGSSYQLDVYLKVTKQTNFMIKLNGLVYIIKHRR